MRTYEVTAVLRPDLDEQGLDAALERMHQRIVEHGGSIVSTERWGKRRLAYPIRRYRDGFYALTVFTLDGSQVGRLRQTLALLEDLLRFVIVSHNPPATQVSQTQQAAPAPAMGVPPQPQTSEQSHATSGEDDV